MKTTSRAAKIRLAAVVGVAMAGIGLTAVTQVAGATEQPAAQSAEQSAAVANAAKPKAARAALPPNIQKIINDFEALTPGAGFVPTAAYPVTSGTQTYTCGADGAWPAGSTPEAQLRKLIGSGPSRVHHFGGPRWAERLPNGSDGSTVLAAVQDPSHRVERPGNLPWLRLTVTAHEGPAGALDGVTHITRLLTSGGLAPAGSCTPGAKSPAIPYGAVYVFWAAA